LSVRSVAIGIQSFEKLREKKAITPHTPHGYARRWELGRLFYYRFSLILLIISSYSSDVR
jgi:hypothetical protein